MLLYLLVLRCRSFTVCMTIAGGQLRKRIWTKNLFFLVEEKTKRSRKDAAAEKKITVTGGHLSRCWESIHRSKKSKKKSKTN